MQNRQNTETRIEEALSSLQNITRAQPRPFLYTRVMARLRRNEKNPWELVSSFLSKPSVAFAGLAMILLVNFFALYNQPDKPSTASSKDIAIADEYNPSAVASLYDYENENTK